MKIIINAGHTLEGPGCGAIGIKNESKENREVAKRVIKFLKELGHEVIECTVDKAVSKKAYLDKVVEMANRYKANYFLSIHFNKFNGKAHGVEAFTYQGIKLDQAERIVKNISSLGFTNRGVKDGSGLSVIRNTNAKAILVECCFIDNIEDMNNYDADKMARAIAEGLTGQKIPEPKKEEDVFFRVISGSFEDKSNAEEQMKELKEKGVDSFIAAYKK